MLRTSLLAALVAVATTTAASATPYPGTISRWQDNADNMSVSSMDVRGGAISADTQVFGAPQDMRRVLGTDSRRMGAVSSVRRNSGTSSDRFQDNADTGR